MKRASRTLVVTGANGSLGQKFLKSMRSDDAFAEVVGIDRAPGRNGFDAPPHYTFLQADLTEKSPVWTEVLARADAVLHLAAVNPKSTASWAEAAASFEMTADLLAAVPDTTRFVFASSNHVMGGYKDTDIADREGALTVDLPPLVGTRVLIKGETAVSTAYATAKLMAERLLAVRGKFTGLTSVALRIGWCQPGENLPSTLNDMGRSTTEVNTTGSLHNLRWFQRMWLSDRDFVGYAKAALTAESAKWPANAVVINAMSANSGMAWNIEDSARYLDFRPLDDSSGTGIHQPAAASAEANI